MNNKQSSVIQTILEENKVQFPTQEVPTVTESSILSLKINTKNNTSDDNDRCLIVDKKSKSSASESCLIIAACSDKQLPAAQMILEENDVQFPTHEVPAVSEPSILSLNINTKNATSGDDDRFKKKLSDSVLNHLSPTGDHLWSETGTDKSSVQQQQFSQQLPSTPKRITDWKEINLESKINNFLVSGQDLITLPASLKLNVQPTNDQAPAVIESHTVRAENDMKNSTSGVDNQSEIIDKMKESVANKSWMVDNQQRIPTKMTSGKDNFSFDDQTFM